MQLRYQTRTVLTAVAAIVLLTAAHADATPGRLADGVRRHHGLGEASTCYETGVRRYHGLGDGYCCRSYGSYSRYSLPYRVIVVDDARVRPRMPIRAPLTGSDRAWSLLGRGEPRQAQTDFSVLALRDTNDATARAGYALAAAALGRHETAAWAMRRAFVTDATAVGDLAIDPAVRRVVQALRAVYAGEAASAPDSDNVDALFMFAALSFLLEEDDVAREAIAAVRQLDRTDRATRILVRLLHKPRPEDGNRLVAALP